MKQDKNIAHLHTAQKPLGRQQALMSDTLSLIWKCYIMKTKLVGRDISGCAA